MTVGIIHVCAVLASCWVGKSPVCSTAIQSDLSQYYRMLLVCTISLLVAVYATVKYVPIFMISITVLLMLSVFINFQGNIFESTCKVDGFKKGLKSSELIYEHGNKDIESCSGCLFCSDLHLFSFLFLKSRHLN